MPCRLLRVIGVVLWLASSVHALTVTVAWDYTDQGQDGFEVLRCTGASCTPSTPLSLSIGPSVRQIGDSTVSGGTTYGYAVRATLSGSGPFPASSTLSVTVPTPGVAEHLAFNPGPPATVYANVVMSPGVTVEVRDYYNAVITGSTASLTLALATATPQDIPQTGVTLVSVDNEETVGSDTAGVKAIDGNPATFWHTEWFAANPPPPHTLIVDLGQSYRVTGFKYVPRQDGPLFGTISQFGFDVSADGTLWGPAVDSGTFTPADATQKTRSFMAKNGRYVRLRALTEINGNPWTSVAELTVVQTPGLGAGSLQGTLTQNAVQGKRTFSDLVVTQAGQYNLLASTAGLPNATMLFLVQDQPVSNAVTRVMRFGR